MVTGGGLKAFFGCWCLGCLLDSEVFSQYLMYDFGTIPFFIDFKNTEVLLLPKAVVTVVILNGKT